MGRVVGPILDEDLRTPEEIAIDEELAEWETVWKTAGEHMDRLREKRKLLPEKLALDSSQTQLAAETAVEQRAAEIP